jgi:hypothetical protein
MLLNHKTLGARNDIGPTGRPLERKEAIQHDDSYWQYNAASGAWYGYHADQAPAPSSPAAPSWADAPSSAAALERAMSAGRAAIAEGFGSSPRADGLVPCMSCTKCNQRAYDQCRRPVQVAVAKALAGQAMNDTITKAEATMVELQGVVWREEARRGLAL